MDATAERSYTTIDKTGWDNGPWQDEPDKTQWVDDTTGLDCLIVRNLGGALCGYVGVPPEHPWHEIHYGDRADGKPGTDDDWDERIDSVIDVHGGLTYSASCQENEPEAESICHIPAPGRPDNVWWFGFDCNHAWDLAPGTAARYRGDHVFAPTRDEVYRDLAYVRSQCADLAQQLAAVASSH